MKTAIQNFQELHNSYLGMAIHCDHSAKMMQSLFNGQDNGVVQMWKDKAEAYRFCASALISTCSLCNIFLKPEPAETKSDRSVLLVTSEKY